MQMDDLPDSRGHFGPYGGVFVAETLVHALDELKRAYERHTAPIPQFLAEFALRAQALRRPAEPGLPREALVGEARRRADLSQARGPEPHRRAQGEQHHRPGAARAAHGQAARDRRDRRRHARRRDRHRRRALRHGVRGVHGHRRTSSASPPNVYRMKLLGATVVPVESGLEDAQGRAERGDARLGHERRVHLLHHRHRRRPASVSDDGARLPAHHRPRVPASRCRRSPDGSPTRSSPASAAARTRSASSIVTSPTATCA